MDNEITVRINCSLQEMYKILESKGFSIVDKFNLDDTYYIKNDIDLKKQPIREILKKYILIRNITQFTPNDFINSYNFSLLTFKNKDIASDGTIISQYKKDYQIQNAQQGKEFLEAIGYKELITIKEKDIVYAKEGLGLAIKDIENGDNLIEVETNEKVEELNTIEKLKAKINELQIPIDTNDYFLKKAEIELKKIL